MSAGYATEGSKRNNGSGNDFSEDSHFWFVFEKMLAEPLVKMGVLNIITVCTITDGSRKKRRRKGFPPGNLSKK
jgi:hypothetical protein